MKIHHIGYLVKNMETSKKSFLSLGYFVEKNKRYDSIRDVNIIFLKNKGGGRIELIEPNKGSSMYPLLKRYRNCPYHICYSVRRLDDAIKKLENNNFIIIKEPEIAPCIDNKKVCFLSCRGIEMIELLEEGELKDDS